MNRLPKTVTRQHRDCDLNPGPSAPESGTLTTRLPSHPNYLMKHQCQKTTLRINGPTAMSLVSVSLCGTQCRISAERCVGCSIDRLRRRHDNTCTFTDYHRRRVSRCTKTPRYRTTYACWRQGSFRAGTHRNAVPVLFLITGTPFRSFSAYSCKI